MVISYHHRDSLFFLLYPHIYTLEIEIAVSIKFNLKENMMNLLIVNGNATTLEPNPVRRYFKGTGITEYVTHDDGYYPLLKDIDRKEKHSDEAMLGKKQENEVNNNCFNINYL